MAFWAGGDGECCPLLSHRSHLADCASVSYINITQDGEPYLSLQLLLGYICYPVAFLIGIPRPDLRKVGELIGIKIIANEFVAFSALRSQPQYIAMSPRSQIIATYALCGEYFHRPCAHEIVRDPRC